ncbi:MAG: glycosyltransferase family 2 protein [Hyphomicrobiaceae bacterium]|nr:glycosyltransferase family 2 protein [Hyphomicrobiaceae bacterium]
MDSVEAGTAVPLIAVCVCTRGRPQMLRRCLGSLRRQDYDAAELRMGLIVVDNNPEPTARPIYEELLEDGEPVGFVHCPHPGIPIARNAALRAALDAEADYIAFLDDDEVAPPHWLALLLRALQESGADAVQGGVRVLPADVDDIAAATVALRPVTLGPVTLATVPLGDVLSPAGPMSWEFRESLATCNVLFKARLVRPPLSLRFDESMQFTGGSDREFFMRAHKRGGKLLRVRDIEVFEDTHAERRTLGYQATRAFAAGSNYFQRISKNELGPMAAARITLRALERSVSGVVKLMLSAALVLALRPRSARAHWRKGCTSLCFAAGCLSPLASIRAYPYRNVQGA